jgi:hypothetical protein
MNKAANNNGYHSRSSTGAQILSRRFGIENRGTRLPSTTATTTKQRDMATIPNPTRRSNTDADDAVVAVADEEELSPSLEMMETTRTTTTSESQNTRKNTKASNNNHDTGAAAADDDDDVTVIYLDAEPSSDNDHPTHTGGGASMALDWIGQQGPEMEARRRVILLRELQRTQRISFCHFLIVCTVPLVLIMIVLTAILADSDECASEVTDCGFEPRSFTNAFTTRCVCDPISIARNENSTNRMLLFQVQNKD